MSIKMPLKFAGNYRVITRHGGSERQEYCQKLTMTPLEGANKEEISYLITYFCFGCRRVLEGKLKENQEDRVLFQVDSREMEFSPSREGCGC